MSAIILNFPRKSLALCANHVNPFVDYCTVNGSDKLFVMDRELGRALGYADPLAAIEELFSRHKIALSMFYVSVDLFVPEPQGRKQIRVFDVDGAMQLCRLAKTPNAGLVFSYLVGAVIRDFDAPLKPNAVATVIHFPVAPKPKRGGRRARRSHHG